MYIPEVWKAAVSIMRQAEEVCIVGYSVAEPDWEAFEQLVLAAENCKRMVVQNPAAEQICRRLKSRLKFFKGSIEPYPDPLETGIAI